MNILSAITSLAGINPKRNPLAFAACIAQTIGDIAAAAQGVPVARNSSGELVEIDATDAGQNADIADLQKQLKALKGEVSKLKNKKK